MTEEQANTIITILSAIALNQQTIVKRLDAIYTENRIGSPTVYGPVRDRKLEWELNG